MEQSLKELELLGLTENDFDLIVKGLESLPNNDNMGELLSEMFIKGISHGEELPPDMKREFDQNKREKAAKKSTFG